MGSSTTTGSAIGIAFVLAATFLVAAARPAAAQPEPPQASEASQLFDRGKLFFDEKRYEEACEALAASDKLEPAVGTLGLLAACHQELGRVATAYREYLETAQRARAAGDPREAYALDRAATARGNAPVLTVSSRGKEPGLAVTRGGDAIPVGEPVLVDPGSYRLVARAPGKKPWETSVTLETRGVASVEVPALADDDDPSRVLGTRHHDPRPVAPGRASDAKPAPDGMRTLGFVVGGIGIGGLAVASVTSAMVIGRDADIDAACPRHSCTPEGRALIDDQSSLLMANGIAWGVGLVGVAAGGALLLWSGTSTTVAMTPAITPAGGSVAWRAVF